MKKLAYEKQKRTGETTSSKGEKETKEKDNIDDKTEKDDDEKFEYVPIFNQEAVKEAEIEIKNDGSFLSKMKEALSKKST